MAKGRDRDRWRIVVAEDNDDHALLIEMALERASTVPVEIVRARNGEEAIEIIDRERPDLVLLDLRMPGRDGHEVLQAIKGNEELRQIPITVLTSSDRDDDVSQSYGMGGNHFLTKPDNPAELENRLRALLKNIGELNTIRRGSHGIDATARSHTGRDRLAVQRVLPWLMVIAVIGALIAFALTQGVL